MDLASVAMKQQEMKKQGKLKNNLKKMLKNDYQCPVSWFN